MENTFTFNLKIYGMNVTSTDANIVEIIHYGFHLTKYNVTAIVKKPLKKVLVS